MATNRGNPRGSDLHESSNPGRPATKGDPKSVADQFSHQYYTVFSNYPRYLYRFYVAESTMSVSEVLEDGSTRASSAESQEGIHELVLQLFGDTTVKLGHVLSQFSQNGGIVMQVNGTLLRKGVERSFAQSFFLAVQEKGFYVLNDILYITPAAPATSPRKDNPPVAAPVVQQPRPLAPPQEVYKQRNTPRLEPVAYGHGHPHGYGHAPGHDQANSHARSNGHVPGHPSSTGHSSSESDIPRAKPTYAESVKGANSTSGTPSNGVKAPEARIQPPATPTSPVETPSSQKNSGAFNNTSNGTGTYLPNTFPHRLNTAGFVRNSSVFVRDIPPNVDENTLRQTFAHYGDVTSVVIRNGRRDMRFAFVDFASTEAMDECLSHDVMVGNRRLFIEEKKPLVLRNKQRYRRASSGSPGPHDDSANGGSGGSITFY